MSEDIAKLLRLTEKVIKQIEQTFIRIYRDAAKINSCHKKFSEIELYKKALI